MPRKTAPPPPNARPVNRWVYEAMQHSGKSGATIAEEMFERRALNSPDRSVINKIVRDGRLVKFEEAQAISEITGFPRLGGNEGGTSLPAVQYTGPLGAGGSVLDVEAAGGEPIPVLAGSADGAVAGNVSGESLGELFDDWYVIYRDKDKFHEGLYGRLCALRTREGETYVKWIRRSEKPKGVKLVSADGSTFKDGVRIDWAAPVIGMRPR